MFVSTNWRLPLMQVVPGPGRLAARTEICSLVQRARLRSLAASYPDSRSTVFPEHAGQKLRDPKVPRRAARIRASLRSSSGRERVMFWLAICAVDNGSRDTYAGREPGPFGTMGDGTGADGLPWRGRNISFLCIKA